MVTAMETILVTKEVKTKMISKKAEVLKMNLKKAKTIMKVEKITSRMKHLDKLNNSQKAGLRFRFKMVRIPVCN